MKNHIADIIATVNLFPTDAGGRTGPTPDEKFNCLMIIDHETFDVRLHLGRTGSIFPGQTVRVPVSFLDREHARRYCSVGKRFILKEIKTIGDGAVDELHFSDDEGAIH